VMTFNLGEDDSIEGEIYISLPRAYEQSQEYGVTIREELSRLVIHGCLHLAGHDDRDDKARDGMKKLEDELVAKAINEYLRNC
jgi:probable rRNA maturation factor